MMKYLLSAFALTLLMSALTPAHAQLSRGNKDYELGAFNLAARSYLELLEKRPANYEAMVKLADAYRYLNQMEEARSWFEKVIREHRLEGEQLFQYALVLKALGQYDKAEQWFMAYARADKDGREKGQHYAQSCVFARNQLGQSSPYLVSNEFINTNASDFGPAFFGDQVVFSSARNDRQKPGSSWTGKSNNQLYMARIGSNGFLEEPVPMQSRTPEQFVNVGPLTVNSELSEVVYTKNNFIDGTRHIPNGGMELSLATASIGTNREWGEEKPFDYNGSSFSNGWPFISPDGNALYFASNRPDGFGGFDLYVSYRMGNTWSAPENLGPTVNSPGDEISPFFDGTHLYFSSNWHPGMGGYDIFRAEEANGRWARIFHLGNLINSARDDYGFIYESRRNIGYMVSNRTGGRGNEDIYKVFKSADNIVLNVRSASDGAPIPYASIDFSNCGEGLFKADSRGTYNFQAVEGLDCDVVVRAEGYTDAVYTVSTMGLRQNREQDIMLTKQGEEYVGTVLDYQSRRPVPGVSVAVTNLSTKSDMETITDAEGTYLVSLAPNAAYLVRYSRPGYRNLDRNVNTGEGNDRSLLGTISMLPVDAAAGGVEDRTVRRPGEDTNRTAPAPQSAAVTQGFSVQVAALSKPGLDAFSELTNIGQVYSKVEDGKYKIRVGVYPSRNKASEALSQIKAKGYNQAFLVTEEGANLMTPKGGGLPQDYDAPAGSGGQPQSYDASNMGRIGSVATGRYKVQLAAYKDTRWFDAESVQGLGRIEELRRNDGLTVKYLAGYETMEAAIRAWQATRSAGFSTAFVVRETTSGELEKVYP